MIFAREVNDGLTSLVKKLDAANAENKKLNSAVILLSDDEKLEDKLKTLVSANKIDKTFLAIDNVPGPKGYNIAKEAEVTVILYNKRKVEVNHALRKGELNEKVIGQIISDLDKILK